MQNVTISGLRANLFRYLQKAHNGEEPNVTSHGKVMATILPPVDKRERAKKALNALSKTAVIGDIVSPISDDWKAVKRFLQRPESLFKHRILCQRINEWSQSIFHVISLLIVVYVNIKNKFLEHHVKSFLDCF